jgi:hypothetical protein
VTQVLDIAAPFPEGLRDYLRVSSFEEQKDRLESTGSRGTKLHGALDGLMNGVEYKLEDFPTTYEKDALLTFKRWMRFLAPTKFETEQVVADLDLRVAGTLDLCITTEQWKLEVLLNPIKFLELDSEGDYQLKHKWLDLPTKIKSKVIIDYKFTGRNAYNHKVQVAKYKHMYNKSYKGPKCTAAYSWRYSPKHKFGFDFQLSELDHNAYKRIFDTFIEYSGGFPEPPNMKVYPKSIRLFDKINNKKGK